MNTDYARQIFEKCPNINLIEIKYSKDLCPILGMSTRATILVNGIVFPRNCFGDFLKTFSMAAKIKEEEATYARRIQEFLFFQKPIYLRHPRTISFKREELT